jgi:hypothetical protein
MNYYVTDGDRIGNRFYDSLTDADRCAQVLANDYPGNRVSVYRLYLESSFYTPVNPKLELIKEIKKFVARPSMSITDIGYIFTKVEELEKMIKEEDK